MFVSDIADACLYFLGKKTKYSLINIGSGRDMSINQFAKKLMKFFKIDLKIKNNKKMPDGVKRKLLDVSLSRKLGWKYKTKLSEGLKITFQDFIKNEKLN